MAGGSKMDSPDAQRRAAAGLSKVFLDSHSDFPNVSARQKSLNEDKPAVGPIWVSRFDISAPPETQLKDLLWRTVLELGKGDEIITEPQYAPRMQAQWTGPRPGVGPKEPESSIAEDQKYAELMKVVGSDKTIIFLQGGSFAFGSMGTARPYAASLSSGIGLRALTVAYRQGPNYTFPAFLLDVLVAYFTLLSPASDSLHRPIKASDIVLVGESAGANLCLALVQTLLHLRRSGIKAIQFNSRSVPLDLPAALAGLSPPGDLTMTLPSSQRFQKTDWSWTVGPWLSPRCPADDTWPSNPPRGEIYVDASALAHPLLSVASVKDWSGAPPMFLSTGEEGITDGTLLVAQTAARQAVPVEFVQYQGMPHLFMAFLKQLPQTPHVMNACTEFCKSVLQPGPSRRATRGTFYKLGVLEPVAVDVKSLLEYSPEEAYAIMEQGRRRRMQWVWRGPTDKKEATSPHKL